MAEQQGVTAASEEVPHQAVVLASDDENADPACGGGEAASLRKLFAEGQAQIATARCAPGGGGGWAGGATQRARRRGGASLA